MIAIIFFLYVCGFSVFFLFNSTSFQLLYFVVFFLFQHSVCLISLFVDIFSVFISIFTFVLLQSYSYFWVNTLLNTFHDWLNYQLLVSFHRYAVYVKREFWEICLNDSYDWCLLVTFTWFLKNWFWQEFPR